MKINYGIQLKKISYGRKIDKYHMERAIAFFHPHIVSTIWPHCTKNLASELNTPWVDLLHPVLLTSPLHVNARLATFLSYTPPAHKITHTCSCRWQKGNSWKAYPFFTVLSLGDMGKCMHFPSLMFSSIKINFTSICYFI